MKINLPAIYQSHYYHFSHARADFKSAHFHEKKNGLGVYIQKYEYNNKSSLVKVGLKSHLLNVLYLKKYSMYLAHIHHEWVQYM